MPTTSLQAILAALAALGNPPNHRIISETQTDATCFERAIKETPTGNGKWIKYKCVDGKESQIVFEIVEPEDEDIEVMDVAEDGPRDEDIDANYRRAMAAREHRMRDKHMRDQKRRDAFQQRQRDEMRRRAKVAKELEEQKRQQHRRQQQQRDQYMREQQRLKQQSRPK